MIEPPSQGRGEDDYLQQHGRERAAAGGAGQRHALSLRAGGQLGQVTGHQLGVSDPGAGQPGDDDDLVSRGTELLLHQSVTDTEFDL